MFSWMIKAFASGERRLPAHFKQTQEAAGQPTLRLSCAFVADALWSGWWFRSFKLIYDFNCKELRIEVDSYLPTLQLPTTGVHRGGLFGRLNAGQALPAWH